MAEGALMCAFFRLYEVIILYIHLKSPVHIGIGHYRYYGIQQFSYSLTFLRAII